MEKTILNISGMHCASCAVNIEGVLKKVTGVESARVNFALEKAYIDFDPKKTSTQGLVAAIEKAGYKAETGVGSSDREKELRDKEVKTLKIKFIIAIVLSSVLMPVKVFLLRKPLILQLSPGQSIKTELLNLRRQELVKEPL